MAYQSGDIVLLRFPFSNNAGSKKRPALVLFQDSDGDLLVCRITSQVYRGRFDVAVVDYRACGLLVPSIIRVHKMATLEQTLVERHLGRLNTQLLGDVVAAFRAVI